MLISKESRRNLECVSKKNNRISSIYLSISAYALMALRVISSASASEQWSFPPLAFRCPPPLKKSAALVSFVNICTANNTVAILTVGSISKKIGDQYGVDNRKAASILDTFSCCVQGLLPYGVQLLLAAGLAGINPVQIIPWLFYPMAIGLAAFLAIIIRYPKKYS